MSCHIEWRCETCGFSIADGAGAIRVDLALVREAEQNPWAGAPWRALHHACDDIDDHLVYAIDIERIRSHEQMLGWTAHLMDKSWLKVTNWTEVLMSQGARV